jgi:hypothetical protein
MPALPRVSGQIAIGQYATPPRGTYVTPPPGGYATPPPGGYPTPPPGQLAATSPSYATPAPVGLTSVLSSLTPEPAVYGELGTAATQSLSSLPKAARHVSLAEAASEPLPRKLKLAAGAIIIGAMVVAVILLLGGHAGDNPDNIGTVPVGVPVDNETRLKAALHDLESGKTCADRKAAIPVLAQIGGDEAIDALKRARYRMRGGVLGIGDSNTNACLKADVERALNDLGVKLR